MVDLGVYSVGDLAVQLKVKTSTVNYLILKYRIDEDGVIANRTKIYGKEKLIALDKLLEKKHKHRREQDVTRIGR